MIIIIITIRGLGGSDARLAELYQAVIFLVYYYYYYNTKTQWLRWSACWIISSSKLIIINIIAIRGLSGSDARLAELYHAVIFLVDYYYYYYNTRTQWLRCSACWLIASGNITCWLLILLQYEDSVAQMLGLLNYIKR